jgi:hypothetical protein
VKPIAAAKENTHNSKIKLDPSFRWDDEAGAFAGMTKWGLSLGFRSGGFRWDDDEEAFAGMTKRRLSLA